ncbi:MAG: hypothetical protein ACRDHW_00025 [Ktedonobacteraceae bacterium]
MSRANFNTHAQPSPPILFDSIPLRLRAGRQHVLWKREQRNNGDIGKVPYIAFSALAGKTYPAKVSNSRTWSNFAQAKQAYERGGWDGIGYVLNESVVLVDLDHCISLAGVLDPRAREIIDLLNSAAEHSPSDGAHIYLLGHLPPGAANRYTYKGLKIEVYGTGRYTTLTGRPITGTPEDLQERTTALANFLAQCQIIQEENTGVCGGGVPGAGEGLDARQNQPTRMPQRKSGEAQAKDQRPGAGLDDQAQAIGEADLTQAERTALQKARAARNTSTFEQLWQGGDPRQRVKANGTPDTSAADFDLILMLLYWTNDDAEQTARLFRASLRYRPGKSGGRLSYLDRTIQKAIERRHYKVRASRKPEPPDDDPGPGGGQKQPAHQDRRITHAHHWTRASETAEQRQQLLTDTAQRIADQARTHLLSDRRNIIQIQAVAPGVGKTHTVSELGLPGSLRLAWIAERRDMAVQVPALQTYRQIEPCTMHNCPDHHLHAGLAAKSRNTMSVHKKHSVPCGYVRQFDSSESAVYQLAHVRTKHPAKAEGIVIDELDLAKWLPEREVTINLLTSTLKLYATDSTADRLIRALEATITDCSQGGQEIHGRALFTDLNRRCLWQLRNWIGELAQDARNLDTHPWTELEEENDMAQQWEIEQMAPIVLPHILVALISELVKWERKRDWNSRLRIGRGPRGWALYLTEPLTFSAGEDGNIPARVVLDATAPDEDILSHVLGERVEIQRAEVTPPPGTRHLAVRTGKRYGLVSLTATPHVNGVPVPNKALLRAAAEIRYLLRELDPDGEIQRAQRVGLVTFKACEAELGDELGIPEQRRLHFWAARGSNALADCDILLVVGTPQQNPASVERLARAIWADDPTPIDPTIMRDEAGRVTGYQDARMERLNRYLTRAELTQCAHRNRALRQARTVVTMCREEIDYLPATETITDLPMLNLAGLDAWKARRKAEQTHLDQARERMEQDGKTVHMIRVRELRAAANCSTDTAAEYLRRERRRAEAEQTKRAEQERRHTHTQPVFSSSADSVPDQTYENSYSHSGTNSELVAPPARPLDEDQEIMQYVRAAGYPALTLDGIQIEAGSVGWSRWMWMSRTPADQRHAVYEHFAGLQQSQTTLAG